MGTVGQWDWHGIKRVLKFWLCVAPLSLAPLCGDGCGLCGGGQRGAYSPSAAPDPLPLSQEKGWRERERKGVKRGEKEREETEDQRDLPTTVLSLELLPLDWDSSVLPLTFQRLAVSTI